MTRKGRSGKGRRFDFRSVVGRTVLFGSALMLLLCYCSIFINPARLWPSAVFTIIIFPVALLNVVVLVLALIGRSRVFWVPALMLVPAAFMADRVLSLSPAQEVISHKYSEDTLNILSYNVGRFSLPRDKSLKDGHLSEYVFRTVKEYGPDIICFQEFWTRSIESMKEMIKDNFPGYDFRYYFFCSAGGYSGNLTISRFPMSSSGVEKFEGSSNLALFNDFHYKGRKLRIYNCHFQSYNISMTGMVKSFVNDTGYARRTGEKVVSSILKRTRQVGQVLDNVHASPHEAIICGDFNDTPMSYTYTSLLSGRKDTFIEAGSGFGASYSVLWPLLRIDYVFVPESFSVLGHNTPKLDFSDHYPVVVSIKCDYE